MSEVDNECIDDINILQASMKAMRAAVADEPVCADLDTATWMAEAAPLIAMGGCGFVAQAAGMGLTCDLDLGASATVQGMAPGVTGSLCHYCCESCAASDQTCTGDEPAPAGPGRMRGDWGVQVSLFGSLQYGPTGSRYG